MNRQAAENRNGSSSAEQRSATPSYLRWKVWTFFAAAAVWLMGVVLDDGRVTALAIGICAIAILLRFAVGHRSGR